MLPDQLSIAPISSFSASVRPPGSKSLTNRAFLLAALADGVSTLRGPLWADDTLQMRGALAALGFDLPQPGAAVVKVHGRNGTLRAPSQREDLRLSVGNAGTSYRFLTAALCLGKSDSRVHLDGIERMRQRPIGQLVDSLRKIGGDISYSGAEGFPPLWIRATGLSGGDLLMPPTLSSQYISAILQVAPYFEKGLTLRFDGPVISRPYVEMTLALMSKFGVDADVDDSFTSIRIEPGGYRAADYAIEPDASNASYFLAAAAVVPGSKCTIEGLGKGSLQGDVGFADVLHQMGADLSFGRDFITILSPRNGVLRGIDVDLNHMPDMAQTLAVVALFAQGETAIRNVGNLRVKETDRVAAIQIELTKLGATVEVEGDDIFISPPSGGKIKPAAIDTYNDHRMAMAFSIAGLRAPGVVINDPKCVEKTFPDYFEYLAKLTPVAKP